jgi:copper transport protein
VRRLAAGFAVAAAFVLLTAGPAAAHAVLESTSPGGGSIVATAPREVTATFDESVGVSVDSLRVFAPDGSRVDDGDTTHGDAGDQIAVGLHGGLGIGTYTVAWHVISADSHPVEGAFTFSIGVASSTSVNAATLGTHASAAVGLLFGAVRWAGYLSFALLFGGGMFLVVCWPGGAKDRRAVRLIAVGWAGSALAGAGSLLLQGVYGGGLPLGRALDTSVLDATLDARFGHAVAVRLLLIALSAPLIAVGAGRLPTAGKRARVLIGGGALLLGVLAAATWAVADHAGTGSQVPIAVPSDVVHLCAMGIWLGGLAVLVFALLRADPEQQAAEPDAVVPIGEKTSAVRRFSPIALACIGSLLVTGVYQAWRNVGSWHALTGTDYGRLVLIKIVGLAAIVGLGRLARQRLAQLPQSAAEQAKQPEQAAPAPVALPASVGTRRPTDRLGGGATTRRPGRRTSRVGAGTAARRDPDAGLAHRAALHGLRRTVAVEAGLAVAILAVSSLLVESEPGRTVATGPTDVTVQFNTGTASGSVLVYVSPAALGLNQAHMYLSDAKGLPYDPAQVTADFVLPAQNLGPLPLTVEQDGPGHYLDVPVVLNFRGTWELEITIRSDNFDETTIRVPVNIS